MKDPIESSGIEAYYPSDSAAYSIPLEEMDKQIKAEERAKKKKEKEMNDALPSQIEEAKVQYEKDMAAEAEKRKEEEATLMKLRKEKAYGDIEEFNRGLEAFKRDFKDEDGEEEEYTEKKKIQDDLDLDDMIQ